MKNVDCDHTADIQRSFSPAWFPYTRRSVYFVTVQMSAPTEKNIFEDNGSNSLKANMNLILNNDKILLNDILTGTKPSRKRSSRKHAYIILTPLNPTFIQ